MKPYESVLQSVIKKIEMELDTLSISDLIAYSGYSKYHFHRLFLVYTGENLAHFMKRLKMQKAATKIQFSSYNVTQIAFDTGYATHSAFCVAFKEMFGVNPTEFKEQKRHYFKEYTMVTPEIIEIESIQVLAVRHIGDYSHCSESWEKLMKYAYGQKFKNGKNLVGKQARRFGISYDDPNTVEISKLRYDACLTKDDDVILEEGIREIIIDGGKYARFLHKGSYTELAQTYNQIFSWIMKNEIELRDAPPFDEYLNSDPRRTKPENLRTLIYIPLR